MVGLYYTCRGRGGNCLGYSFFAPGKEEGKRMLRKLLRLFVVLGLFNVLLRL
jgi:hypothetical protein